MVKLSLSHVGEVLNSFSESKIVTWSTLEMRLGDYIVLRVAVVEVFKTAEGLTSWCCCSAFDKDHYSDRLYSWGWEGATSINRVTATLT